ncbi:ileal sodium/bile acid cotransporter [Venturia canescens]|uniref:ileal sodium/bile acid cotransporter n=1 Tax=Venturia canescens TaxID=32260 RepID=UPI001C9CF399|nr:ileal sodium/bile acid cotransporter [Venturia canescens]XP_043267402.1 ileal sodium/bile acid cotransporter [Venturia canescens]XP_043267403.1 ileal sodium/bile acid cotransporter [Venturia canescens]
MKLFLLVLCLVGNTWAQEWSVLLETASLTIYMDDTVGVPFSVTIPKNTGISTINLAINNSDAEVVAINAPKFYSNENNGETWNSTINITGLFIGKSRISLSFSNKKNAVVSDELDITVIRAHRLIDTLFTASVAILVSILYINFGCAMDWGVCRDTLRRPVGIAVGAFCQFVIMPLIGYALGQLLFSDRPEMQIGIFFTGISPSGGASNIWTVLLGGNINLSVTMTTLGTIASFATMPIWIFSLGKQIFDKGNLVVPYSRIAFLAVGLIIPLSLGYIIQKKMPKLCRVLVRIMKPFSGILILFIVIFAIVTNLYLFKLFSWKIVVSGMGLAWIGYICGYIAMIVFKQPKMDVRAIAIETGIQNTGIAIFLLRFSLTQPGADLTTVIPVSCAIMTPIPLAVFWLIKLVYDRRKKKHAASMEKLQKIAEPINAITPTVLY